MGNAFERIWVLRHGVTGDKTVAGGQGAAGIASVFLLSGNLVT